TRSFDHPGPAPVAISQTGTAAAIVAAMGVARHRGELACVLLESSGAIRPFAFHFLRKDKER
ncbi:MAG: hypothetical protein ACYC6Y_32300, partial [Thermoguttaceae bacterium]